MTIPPQIASHSIVRLQDYDGFAGVFQLARGHQTRCAGATTTTSTFFESVAAAVD